jgi:hypothetical protein
MILEERLESCETTTDLMIHAGPLSDVISKIEHTVVSCHKLEESMGSLMDEQQLLAFTTKIVDAIALVITDPDLLDQISNKIMEIVDESV